MGNEGKLREIGARLRAARQVAGYTLEQVAAMLRERGFKATKQAVSHWEAGIRSVDILIVAELAKHYRQSIDALVWENGSPDFHVDSFLAMYSLKTDFRVESED